MRSIVLGALAVPFLIVAVIGCCTFKRLTGSQDEFQSAPTVDMARYKRLAVVSARPIPNDPLVSQVEVLLNREATRQPGVVIYSQAQIQNLQRLFQQKLDMLRQQTNFDMQVAETKRQQQQAIVDEASANNAAVAESDAAAHAEYMAYTQASSGIAEQYKAEVMQILHNARTNPGQFQIPEIDALVVVDLIELGLPEITRVAGGYGGYGGSIATGTLHARVGWQLVDATTGALVPGTGDIYDPKVDKIAEVGAQVQGASGQVNFDLRGAQSELWELTATMVARNFYPHMRKECEE